MQWMTSNCSTSIAYTVGHNNTNEKPARPLEPQTHQRQLTCAICKQNEVFTGNPGGCVRTRLTKKTDWWSNLDKSTCVYHMDIRILHIKKFRCSFIFGISWYPVPRTETEYFLLAPVMGMPLQEMLKVTVYSLRPAHIRHYTIWGATRTNWITVSGERAVHS